MCGLACDCSTCVAFTAPRLYQPAYGSFCSLAILIFFDCWRIMASPAFTSASSVPVQVEGVAVERPKFQAKAVCARSSKLATPRLIAELVDINKMLKPSFGTVLYPVGHDMTNKTVAARPPSRHALLKHQLIFGKREPGDQVLKLRASNTRLIRIWGTKKRKTRTSEVNCSIPTDIAVLDSWVVSKTEKTTNTEKAPKTEELYATASDDDDGDDDDEDVHEHDDGNEDDDDHDDVITMIWLMMLMMLMIIVMMVDDYDDNDYERDYGGDYDDDEDDDDDDDDDDEECGDDDDADDVDDAADDDEDDENDDDDDGDMTVHAPGSLICVRTICTLRCNNNSHYDCSRLIQLVAFIL